MFQQFYQSNPVVEATNPMVGEKVRAWFPSYNKRPNIVEGTVSWVLKNADGSIEAVEIEQANGNLTWFYPGEGTLEYA